MADDTEPKRAPRGFGFPLGILCLLLLLYLLSPPPLLLYFGKSQPRSALQVFYSPIMWASEHVPVVDGFYDWYFTVWGFE
jgi:hypothetical protein